MRVTILKENFLKGLNIVSRATSKSFTLPVLNNILLTGEKNFLKLSGTDLEVGIKYWILAKIEKEGSITVPAKFLINLITLAPEEKISLEVKKDTLFIEGKNYKNQVKGLKAEDFPIIPEVSKENSVDISGEDLSEGLDQLVNIASPSQTRPEISGICFCLSKKEIEMAATDSFRLAEKKVSLLKPAEEKRTLIVLQKTARELINIFGENSSRVIMYFNPNQVMFESEMKETSHPKVQIISRLIEGEYPNYKEIIPQDFKSESTLKKQELLNQIKTASLFSGKINEVRIKVNPKKEALEVFAQNPDLGQSTSQIKGKIKGEETEVSFNYRFLIDGLSNIKGKEVMFGLNGEEGPGVLRSIENDNYIYVVMPVKNS